MFSSKMGAELEPVCWVMQLRHSWKGSNKVNLHSDEKSRTKKNPGNSY